MPHLGRGWGPPAATRHCLKGPDPVRPGLVRPPWGHASQFRVHSQIALLASAFFPVVLPAASSWPLRPQSSYAYAGNALLLRLQQGEMC